MCRPLVKRTSDPYDKPLFPPKLEWFQIYRGDSEAGELLAAFELFQVFFLAEFNLTNLFAELNFWLH